MPTLRGYKYEYLIRNGMGHKEATEFSRQYSMSDLRSLPYLRTMIRTRRLYRDSLKARGYTDRNIQGAIANLYYKNHWQNPDGTFDTWAMLRKFRKDAIVSGDYVPIKKPKDSHHKVGVSKGDVDLQRARSRAKRKGIDTTSDLTSSYLRKIALLNVKIDAESNPERKAKLTAERQKLWSKIR